MKSYTVFDNELKTISMLNAWATLFFSLASGMVSLWAGIWSNLFVTDKASELATKYGFMLECIFGGAAGLFLLLAIGAIISKQSEIHKIKSEAGEYIPPWWERWLVQFGIWRICRPNPTVVSEEANAGSFRA